MVLRQERPVNGEVLGRKQNGHKKARGDEAHRVQAL
jgi:hypothetical protein